MSQRLQYEMHLDADQLNAFVEGVLPVQAREETLAHLAVCAGCREVLRLSLPPMEDVAQPEPVRVRKPWFSGCNLAWPVAVLAGLILVAVYLRTRTASERRAVEVQQTEVTAPLPLPAPTPQVTPAEGRMAEGKAATSTRAEAGRWRSPAVGSAAGRIKLPTIHEGRADSVNGPLPAMMASNGVKLPVQGREMPEAAKISRGALADKQLGPLPTRVTMGAGSPAPAPGVASGSAAGAGYGSAQGISGGASGGIVINNAAVQPQAAAGSQVTLNVRLQPSSESQTVSVQAAAVELATSDAAVAEAVHLAYVATLRPLPSGLPATSVASGKRQMVAIDLHNNVFFSKNGGKHWKAVAAQWQGRAVKVAMAPDGAGSAVEFELTTDKGVVWVSADGRSWRQK